MLFASVSLPNGHLQCLCCQMVFSPLWFSRHNRIDMLASGSDVFPCPDTEGIAMGVGK